MTHERYPTPKEVFGNKKLDVDTPSSAIDQSSEQSTETQYEYKVGTGPEDIGEFVVVDVESTNVDSKPLSRTQQLKNDIMDDSNREKIETAFAKMQDPIVVEEKVFSEGFDAPIANENKASVEEELPESNASEAPVNEFSGSRRKKNKKQSSAQGVTDAIGRRKGDTSRDYVPKKRPSVNTYEAPVAFAVPVDEVESDGVDMVNQLFNASSAGKADSSEKKDLDAMTSEVSGIDDGFIRRDIELYAPEGPYTQEQLAREERMRAFRKSSEYTDARGAYKEQDNSLAASVARRMKVGAFARRKTREALQDTVDMSLESYEKVAEVFDDIQIKKWKNADPGISEADIAKKLALYHEAKQRLHGIHQRQELHTTEKSSKYGFINKAQEWNEKIQQKYAGLSKKQKLGVAAAGIAVGGVAGFALGGFGALGGGLLVAAKGYQTYAKSHSELYNVDKVSPAQLSRKGNEKARSQNSMQKETQDSIRSAVTGRIEKADTINKRAKWMTIGSVALLGLGAAEKFGAFKEIGDWVREAGVPDLNTTPGNTVEDVPTADPVETNTPESDPPLDTDRPDGADDGTDRGSTGEAGTEGGDSYSWSGDALNVSSGEGWYQTFAEMGVTDFADQQALLNDSELMNKLYDQGLAYPDASAGGWGMNLTFDGKMPRESLDLIADHAVEKGLVSRSIFDLAA